MNYVLLKRHIAPILISLLGGMLLGLIYMLVALSALLVYDNLIYAATFGIMSILLMLGPVSLIILYIIRFES